MKVVISQPMYFPWIGILEQIKLADVFVFYDDVQFTRGFFNRVQIKRRGGPAWITIPLDALKRCDRINEVKAVPGDSWRQQHLHALKLAYEGAPHLSDAMQLLDGVLAGTNTSLSEISIMSTTALAEYFSISSPEFARSSDLGVGGSGSQRLLDICRHLGATQYITGHGAKNYLDHALFSRYKIDVQYMNYRKRIYPQMHGEFTPYVSALDLVANCGRAGTEYISPGTLRWKDFLHEPE